MLLENGIWISKQTPRKSGQGAALFLDRDGVVIEEAHYISRADDVVLEHGAVELLKWARDIGLAIVVVTNQSGIARGLFGWAEFDAVEAEITRQLSALGVSTDLTIACAFHKDHTPDFGAAQERWRKPGPAMLELGASMVSADLAASWMVGDRASDIGAAANAGLSGAIHVQTGHGAKASKAALALARDGFAVTSVADPMAALQILRDAFASKSA
ncbi:MAG: HAD-IIIA family hydrolase [Parvibaculum sp.]|nr:HAD-IIIA family hydrolase [Parvibaculum sp.]